MVIFLESLSGNRDVMVIYTLAIWLVNSIRDDKVPEDGDEDGDDGVDDVHFSRALEPYLASWLYATLLSRNQIIVNALKALRSSGLDKSRSQSTHTETSVEDATASGDLVSAIPRAKDVVHRWEESCFEPTDHKAVCSQLCIRVDTLLEYCKDTSKDVTAWYKPMHRDIGHDEPVPHRYQF